MTSRAELDRFQPSQALLRPQDENPDFLETHRSSPAYRPFVVGGPGNGRRTSSPRPCTGWTPREPRLPGPGRKLSLDIPFHRTAIKLEMSAAAQREEPDTAQVTYQSILEHEITEGLRELERPTSGLFISGVSAGRHSFHRSCRSSATEGVESATTRLRCRQGRSR